MMWKFGVLVDSGRSGVGPHSERRVELVALNEKYPSFEEEVPQIKGGSRPLGYR